MKSNKRLAIIVGMRKSGYTFKVIGERLGISLVRAHDLYTRTPEYQEERAKKQAVSLSKRISQRVDMSIAGIALSKVSVPIPTTIRKEDYLKPTVYILMSSKDIPLYVGSSRQGIVRALFGGHKADGVSRVEAWKQTSHVQIYEADSVEHMRLLEVKLMVQLNPEFNQVQIRRFRVINGMRVR